MTRYVAFLRAINVGGRTVPMATLRQHFEALELTGVETFIASGNVIFESKAREKALVARIEGHLRQSLGYEVDVFLRAAGEVAAIAGFEPFAPKELASAVALNVGLLAAPLGAAEQRKLAGLETEIDFFHAHGREFYWLCRERQSDSTFSNRVFEKALGLRTTLRGLATIRRLAAKISPPTPKGPKSA